VSPAEAREVGRRIVTETTAAQGVPYYLEDEAILLKVARLMLHDRPERTDGGHRQSRRPQPEGPLAAATAEEGRG
jgi:hypothetical protein